MITSELIVVANCNSPATATVLTMFRRRYPSDYRPAALPRKTRKHGSIAHEPRVELFHARPCLPRCTPSLRSDFHSLSNRKNSTHSIHGRHGPHKPSCSSKPDNSCTDIGVDSS